MMVGSMVKGVWFVSLLVSLQTLKYTNTQISNPMNVLLDLRAQRFFVGLVALKPLALQLLGATSLGSIDQIFVDLHPQTPK
jgi:predicted ferric reductase